MNKANIQGFPISLHDDKRLAETRYISTVSLHLRNNSSQQNNNQIKMYIYQVKKKDDKYPENNAYCFHRTLSMSLWQSFASFYGADHTALAPLTSTKP